MTARLTEALAQLTEISYSESKLTAIVYYDEGQGTKNIRLGKLANCTPETILKNLAIPRITEHATKIVLRATQKPGTSPAQRTRGISVMNGRLL